MNIDAGHIINNYMTSDTYDTCSCYSELITLFLATYQQQQEETISANSKQYCFTVVSTRLENMSQMGAQY